MSERESGWKGKWMRTGEGEKEGEGRGGDQKELFTAFYKEKGRGTGGIAGGQGRERVEGMGKGNERQ
jgi:hypothetical protein